MSLLIPNASFAHFLQDSLTKQKDIVMTLGKTSRRCRSSRRKSLSLSQFVCLSVSVSLFLSLSLFLFFFLSIFLSLSLFLSLSFSLSFSLSLSLSLRLTRQLVNGVCAPLYSCHNRRNGGRKWAFGRACAK